MKNLIALVALITIPRMCCYMICELNKGPNLAICQQSNNSTHSCCLAVPQNGNAPLACGPVEVGKVEGLDKSDYYRGFETYMLYCISDVGIKSIYSTQVQSQFNVDTGISTYSNFQQNCGNYNPSKLEDCTQFGTQDTWCCFVVSQNQGQEFRLCQSYPQGTNLLDAGGVYTYCGAPKNITGNNSSYSRYLQIGQFCLLALIMFLIII